MYYKFVDFVKDYIKMLLFIITKEDFASRNLKFYSIVNM